jgi:hypothetical protein
MQTAPVVNGLEEEYGTGLQVVRLNFNDRANDRATKALGVRGHPTIVLLDRAGEISRTWFGTATAEDLRPLVNVLVEP